MTRRFLHFASKRKNDLIKDLHNGLISEIALKCSKTDNYLFKTSQQSILDRNRHKARHDWYKSIKRFKKDCQHQGRDEIGVNLEFRATKVIWIISYLTGRSQLCASGGYVQYVFTGFCTFLHLLVPPTWWYSVITPSHCQEEFAHGFMIICLLVEGMRRHIAACSRVSHSFAQRQWLSRAEPFFQQVIILMIRQTFW